MSHNTYLRNAHVLAFVYDVTGNRKEQEQYLTEMYEAAKANKQSFISFLIFTKTEDKFPPDVAEFELDVIMPELEHLGDLTKKLNVHSKNIFICSAKRNTLIWEKTFPKEKFEFITHRAEEIVAIQQKAAAESKVSGQSSAENKVSSQPSFDPKKLHKKYDRIWEQNKNTRCTFFSRAKDIFINYAYAPFHWDRNHVDAIQKILLDEKKPVTNVDNLLARVKEINLKNPIGSLARRIAFVELKKTEQPKQGQNHGTEMSRKPSKTT